MKIEVLASQDFDRNFGDLRECESLWKEVSEKVADAILYSLNEERTASLKEDILNNKAVFTKVGYMRLKTDLNKCPLCASGFEEPFASISIVDNKTKICPDCGTREQLESYTGTYDR